jgi:hypothetical protein
MANIKPSRKSDFSNEQDCKKIYSLYSGKKRPNAEIPALYHILKVLQQV